MYQFANTPTTASPSTPWSTLSAGIDAATLTIPVTDNTPFPQTVQFDILIESEWMLVTGGAGTNTWTVSQRGLYGSTAAVHAAGVGIKHVLTAAGLRGATVGSSSPTQILFHGSGSPAGSANLTWDNALAQLTIGDQSALDSSIQYGFAGGQIVTISGVGGAADTPWIGQLVQFQQTHDDQNLVGSYVAALWKQSAASTTGSGIGHAVDLYLDVASGATNSNIQVGVETSVYAIGTAAIPFVSAFQNRIQVTGGGSITEARVYEAQGGSGSIGTYKAFAVRAVSSPTTAWYGLHIEDAAGLTSATKHAINYGAGKFIVDSDGKVTVPAAGLTIGTTLVTLSGNFTTTGAFNPTFAIPSSSTWTFPSGGGTLLVAAPLLSANATDATAGSVARGDLITGQGASPKWVRLAKGSANQVLAMDGTATDIVWASPASGGVTSIATTSPISGGTITSTGTISLLVNVDFAFTAGQTITAPVGSKALTLAGGTQTASFPVIDATQTWNNAAVAFTGIKFVPTVTAAAAGSLFMTLGSGTGAGSGVSLGSANDISANVGSFGLWSTGVTRATNNFTLAGGSDWTELNVPSGGIIYVGAAGGITFSVTSAVVTFGDGKNIVLNTSTGTKIGTGTTQKLGLWNVTPIIQPAGAGQAAYTDSTGGTPAASLVDVGVVFSQANINNNFATVSLLLLAMRTAMVNSGLMKGAA